MQKPDKKHEQMEEQGVKQLIKKRFYGKKKSERMKGKAMIRKWQKEEDAED